jgi:dTDP-4-dehydrorhamnose reductase
MSRSVWITGAGGLIGSYLLKAAPPGWTVQPIRRKDLDDFASKAPPDLIIHCAALSKAAACEKEPERARKLNVELTRKLCEFAADTRLIFFSTDLVFDGSKGNYAEADATNPLTIYGRTKAEAEQIVLTNPKHTAIRLALNAGISPTRDRGFNEEIHNAWCDGETLNLFTDEFRTPLPAAVTARAVWELALKGASGLFHLGGAEKLSRWQIGQLLAERWKDVEPRMKPGSVRDYQGPPRSPDTSMNCVKVQKLLSFPLPRFSDWLRDNPNEPI